MEHGKLFAAVLVSAVLAAIVLTGSKFFGTPIPNVSAVLTEQYVGVYWEQNCSTPVTAINWTTLEPGQVKDVVVYVRNEGNETFVLALTTQNWNPENASRYLDLTLYCEDAKIEVGEVAEVTLSLFVSPSTTGIYDFSFDIVFEGREFFSGDLGRDGSVDVFDLIMFKAALGSTPADSNWNPRADLDDNGIIDVFDFFLLRIDFGESW